jgi:MraZ protein
VFVPAKMRDILGSHFTVSKSFDKCIEIHSDIGWESKISDIASKKGTSVANLKRFIGVYSEDVTLDKQGRILIPAHFREYANIGKEVVIIGAITHAEIWDKQEWERFSNECATSEDAKKEMDHLYGDDSVAL